MTATTFTLPPLTEAEAAPIAEMQVILKEANANAATARAAVQAAQMAVAHAHGGLALAMEALQRASVGPSRDRVHGSTVRMFTLRPPAHGQVFRTFSRARMDALMHTLVALAGSMTAVLQRGYEVAEERVGDAYSWYLVSGEFDCEHEQARAVIAQAEGLFAPAAAAAGAVGGKRVWHEAPSIAGME